MLNRSVVQVLASLVDARRNCIKSGNEEWKEHHEVTIKTIVRAHLPHGAGFDIGTELDMDKSSSGRLVFSTSFHHMDEMGGYDGWTDHSVIVTPSLTHVFDLRITGRDRNGIKDYIADVFSGVLHMLYTAEEN